LLVALEPAEGRVHHLVGRPLHGGEVEVLEFLQVEAIVVVVEPLVEAPAAVEHERADEGRRLVAARGEDLGQRLLRLAERGAAVDAYAVEGGLHPRQE
jgi:hypothetical protein